MTSNRIKELRKSANLTLKELSEKVGLANNTISQYENGKREPKLETWQKLADFFGVSVPYLQGLDDNESVNHGYSKEYIYKQLLRGYNATPDNNDFEDVKEIIAGISLRADINLYLKKHKIKKPKQLTLDFIKENFAFIFEDENIKRLLTTKDTYSDSEIINLLSTVFFFKSFTPEVEKVLREIANDNQ